MIVFVVLVALFGYRLKNAPTDNKRPRNESINEPTDKFDPLNPSEETATMGEENTF